MDIDYEKVVEVIKWVKERSKDPIRPYHVCTIIDYYIEEIHGRLLTMEEMIEIMNVVNNLGFLDQARINQERLVVSTQMEISAYFDHRNKR